MKRIVLITCAPQQKGVMQSQKCASDIRFRRLHMNSHTLKFSKNIIDRDGKYDQKVIWLNLVGGTWTVNRHIPMLIPNLGSKKATHFCSTRKMMKFEASRTHQSANYVGVYSHGKPQHITYTTYTPYSSEYKWGKYRKSPTR